MIIYLKQRNLIEWFATESVQNASIFQLLFSCFFLNNRIQFNIWFLLAFPTVQLKIYSYKVFE